MFVLAAVVRWPHLQRVPRYTDEVKEIMWALRIYWGEHLPLAAHNGYSGPVWNYLLAGLFGLFGPSTALPRLTVLVIGCLTVCATYVFARVMGGRVAGLIAGVLTATSFIPVYLNSHVAWSVCIVPLFTTLTLTAVYLGVRRSAGPWLVVAGVLAALAIQAHPLGVLLAPAAAVWLLLQRQGRALLRTPWPYLGAGAAALGYGNMIWFHASSRMETVSEALDKLSDGVPGERSLGGYGHTVEALLGNLIDLLTAKGHHGLALFRADPATFVWGAALLLVAVLAYAAWRSESLPLVTVLTTALLMPLFNTNYGFPLGARYLSFLLPVVYAGLGLAAAAALAQLRARGTTAHRAGAVGIALVTLALALAPLPRLRHAYAGEEARGQTNDLAHEIAAIAVAGHEAGETILLSEKIDAKYSGGGHLHRVMATLLGLEGVPTVKVHQALRRIDEQLVGCEETGCLLIIPERQFVELSERYPLEAVSLSSVPLPEDGEAYGVYRYRR